MPTYVLRNGELVLKDLAPPKDSTNPAPNVISDNMPETRHMATGRYHTSKSQFRQDTKASGCIEYGNDSSLFKPRQPVRLSREQRFNDIKQTIEQLKGRR